MWKGLDILNPVYSMSLVNKTGIQFHSGNNNVALLLFFNWLTQFSLFQR